MREGEEQSTQQDSRTLQRSKHVKINIAQIIYLYVEGMQKKAACLQGDEG